MRRVVGIAPAMLSPQTSFRPDYQQSYDLVPS